MLQLRLLQEHHQSTSRPFNEVWACLRLSVVCPHYTKGKMVLHITHKLSHNLWPFENFKMYVCGAMPDACNSHCHHQWYTQRILKDDETYKKFY